MSPSIPYYSLVEIPISLICPSIPLLESLCLHTLPYYFPRYWKSRFREIPYYPLVGIQIVPTILSLLFPCWNPFGPYHSLLSLCLGIPRGPYSRCFPFWESLGIACSGYPPFLESQKIPILAIFPLWNPWESLCFLLFPCIPFWDPWGPLIIKFWVFCVPLGRSSTCCSGENKSVEVGRAYFGS